MAAAEHLRLLDLGCPGETTRTFAGSPATAACTSFYRDTLGVGSQEKAALAELARHRGQVRLVTFDLGANDVDGCFSGGSLSETCVLEQAAAAESRLPGIVSSLAAALRRDDPGARLVAMDYYDPFLGLAEDPGGGHGVELAALSLTALEAFDASMRAVYHHAGVAVADVAGDFGTTSSLPLTTYGTKRLARNVALVCRWTWMCPLPGSRAGQDIHPNDAGYARIAHAFEQVIGPASGSS